MLSVAKLDFGDCYTGLPVHQVLSIKNVTENTMEVYFDSNASHEVSFDLITDNDRQESEHEPIASKSLEDSESDSDPESLIDTIDATSGMRFFKFFLSMNQLTPWCMIVDLEEKDEDEPSTMAETKPPSSHKVADVIRHSRIEEISLGPGAEKTIKVWYCPEPEEVTSFFLLIACQALVLSFNLLKILASSTIVPGSGAVERLATLSQRNFQIDITCKNHDGQVCFKYSDWRNLRIYAATLGAHTEGRPRHSKGLHIICLYSTPRCQSWRL